MGDASRFEPNERYAELIARLNPPSFGGIRSIAYKLLSENYSTSEIHGMYDELHHGTRVLDREELLWRYLYAFAPKHMKKMELALSRMWRVFRDLSKESMSIIDWGCGQALASCCLLDYLNDNRIFIPLDEVVLIEPSELALRYAALHLTAYGITQTKALQKYLDDITAEDIETKSPVTLHLFSNILDMDGFDMKRLVQTIGASASGVHYFVCLSPVYNNNNGMSRIELFKSYFTRIDTVRQERRTQNRVESSAISELASLIKPQKTAEENFTMELLIFKYECGKSSVVDVGYYPPVQFFASYELDCMHEDAELRIEDDDALSAFEVAAPFELGAKIYDDVNPLFAVLNNIIVRGLPTRTSPFVENAFGFSGNARVKDDLGGIAFRCADGCSEAIRRAQLYVPIGVARLEKVIVEALITGLLDISRYRWRVIAIERDVPCAALAFEDLRQMLWHASALSKQFKSLKMPEIDLTVICADEWLDSPLHLDAHVAAECDDRMRSSKYDMVIDMSVLGEIDESRAAFSEFRARNNCYFVVGRSNSVRSRRTIYTSDTIEYEPLGSTDGFGRFQEDEEMLDHLRYFLNLLFRKQDFRPGQVPILNRALQNKSVIGLLPTGGGKSLTYQLASMLQPGVTLVIDPLRALMQDQYAGLAAAGIDDCTFINSTISDKERDKRLSHMEASEMQFVFVSPERLCMQSFRNRLSTMRDLGVYFAYGVIDEVHCVSEWGHDFRFSYLHLGRNLYNFVHTKNGSGHLTLFGLTATASFDVLADVERELSGDGAYPLDANTVVRYEDTDRLELQYKIERVPVRFEADKSYDARHVIDPSLPRAVKLSNSYHDSERASKSEYLALHLRDAFGEIEALQQPGSIERIKSRFAERHNVIDEFGDVELTCSVPKNPFDKSGEYEYAGIVFCPHRANTPISVMHNAERLSESIADIGTFVGSSDGDEDLDAQSFESLELFKENKLPLMVATKAFGMGIDKPNVRFSVNMNYPSSLESFVQEAGRAGRDKRIALARVLVSDYSLARVRPDYPGDGPIERALKGRWFYEQDLHSVLDYYGIRIARRHVDIANPGNDLIENPDYATNEYFYSQNFMGIEVEKRTLYELFCKQSVELVRSDRDDQSLYRIENLLDEVISAAEGTGLVARIPYVSGKPEKGKQKPINHEDNVQKMIYRMCCIGFIDDYTQHYLNRKKGYFLIKMVRKKDGGYYDALKRFLMRYYAEERAEEIVSQVLDYRGDNEIQKCLGYLTEFVYEKIAVKRKRAMDDMRLFCNTGLDSSKDWLETNEDLKDFIYYYFNSKYANDEYVADNGEPFSLTNDTDEGKQGSFETVMKYLRVVDDDLVGAGGTPIDNAKHLQGAVRLIRRALTDENHALALLNYFCLTQLGTNESEALEQELRNDYLSGMVGFAQRSDSQEEFWRFKQRFDEAVEAAPHRYDLSQLSELHDEITAKVHLAALHDIRKAYLDD